SHSITTISLSDYDVYGLKSLFDRYRQYLACLHCGTVGGLVADGMTKGTMRVKCSSTQCKSPLAKKGRTFNVREALKHYQNKEAQRLQAATAASESTKPDDSEGENLTNDIACASANNTTIPALKEIQIPHMNNETMNTNDATKTKRIRKDLSESDSDAMEGHFNAITATLENQSRIMEKILNEMAQLQKEMKEKDACICKLQEELTRIRNISEFPTQQTKTPAKTYAEIARGTSINGNYQPFVKTFFEEQNNHENKPGTTSSESRKLRLLTDYEMNCIRTGRPFFQPFRLKTIYLKGIKRTRITLVKSFLATAQINLKKIHNIGFIGRSVTEIHMEDRYTQEFTMLVEKVGCQILQDFNPLCTDNFKLDEFTELSKEKQKEKALELLQKRLSSQLQRTPERMISLKTFLTNRLDHLCKPKLNNNTIETNAENKNADHVELVCNITTEEDETENATNKMAVENEQFEEKEKERDIL